MTFSEPGVNKNNPKSLTCQATKTK